MKAGDQFIRYDKGKPAVKGIVKRIWSISSYDIFNRVRIKKEMLESEDGQIFEKNQCYLIDSELSIRLWLRLRKLIKF